MHFTQESSIWAVIKNAYTNNDQPIIFALANVLFLIAIGIAIYGAIKWRKGDKSIHLTTIVASIISLIFLIFAVIYLINPNNRLGSYEGKVDIAFTSSIDNSDNKIAIFSDKDSDNSEINSFVMKASVMKDLDIKAGKTVQIESHDQQKTSKDVSFIDLNKKDVVNVKDSSSIKNYNDEQTKAEEAKKKQEEKDKKEKEDKKKKDDKKKDKKD